MRCGKLIRSRQLKSKQPTAKWGHVFSTKFGRKSKRDRAARIYYGNHTEWNETHSMHSKNLYTGQAKNSFKGD